MLEQNPMADRSDAAHGDDRIDARGHPRDRQTDGRRGHGIAPQEGEDDPSRLRDELLAAWRESFPDAFLHVDEATGALSVRHTLAGPEALSSPVSATLDGHAITTPLALMAWHTAERAAGNKRAWVNMYEITLPDAAGTKGRPSVARVYIRALERVGIPACGARSRWCGLLRVGGVRSVCAWHCAVGLHPVDFCRRTTAALCLALRVMGRRTRPRVQSAPFLEGLPSPRIVVSGLPASSDDGFARSSEPSTFPSIDAEPWMAGMKEAVVGGEGGGGGKGDRHDKGKRKRTKQKDGQESAMDKKPTKETKNDTGKKKNEKKNKKKEKRKDGRDGNARERQQRQDSADAAATDRDLPRSVSEMRVVRISPAAAPGSFWHTVDANGEAAGTIRTCHPPAGAPGSFWHNVDANGEVTGTVRACHPPAAGPSGPPGHVCPPDRSKVQRGCQHGAPVSRAEFLRALPCAHQQQQHRPQCAAAADKNVQSCDHEHRDRNQTVNQKAHPNPNAGLGTDHAQHNCHNSNNNGNDHHHRHHPPSDGIGSPRRCQHGPALPPGAGQCGPDAAAEAQKRAEHAPRLEPPAAGTGAAPPEDAPAPTAPAAGTSVHRAPSSPAPARTEAGPDDAAGDGRYWCAKHRVWEYDSPSDSDEGDDGSETYGVDDEPVVGRAKTKGRRPRKAVASRSSA